MKYVDEFRSAELARGLSAEIASLVRPGETVRIMEVCGGHTHAIYRHGLEDLLPPEVELVHGPGCPVCVIPMAGSTTPSPWPRSPAARSPPSAT